MKQDRLECHLWQWRQRAARVVVAYLQFLILSYTEQFPSSWCANHLPLASSSVPAVPTDQVSCPCERMCEHTGAHSRKRRGEDCMHKRTHACSLACLPCARSLTRLPQANKVVEGRDINTPCVTKYASFGTDQLTWQGFMILCVVHGSPPQKNGS